MPRDGASGLNVLVFGAARYTGAHIAASFLERGHQVTLLDIRASAQDESDDEPASAVLASEERPLHLMDPHARELPLDPSAFDALVFAGHDPYASGAHTPPMRDELEDELAALGLILAARPRALVLVSSAIVYAPGEPRFSERSSASGAVGLAAHCLALESRARDSVAPDGRGLVVLRASVVAGASSRVSRRRRAGKAGYLLPGLVPVGNTDRSVSAVVPDAPEPFADQNTMDFVHVEDLARAVALALEASTTDVAGRTFNVGSGRCFRAAELLPEIEWGETVHVHVDLPSGRASECTATVDASEARRVLGWVPEVDDVRILEEELSCFGREVLGAQRVASATRLLHEYISSSVHGGVLSLYGLIGAMGRQEGSVLAHMRLDIGGELYTPELLRLGPSSARVEVAAYRLRVPLESALALPAQNPVRAVYLNDQGQWFRRRLRFGTLRRAIKHWRGRLHFVSQGSSTLYFRQAGKNLLYLVVRPQLATDRMRLRPKIAMARLLARLWPKKTILLYEKQSSRYEESASILFEQLVDRGYHDARFVLAHERLHEVPDAYRKYVVTRFSFEHFYRFFCARLFLGTEAAAHSAELRTASRPLLKKLFGGGFTYVFLQHGVMYMVSLGSSQRAPFRAGTAPVPPGSKIVCSSQLEARHFMEDGGFEQEDLYVCGLPKFDRSTRVPDADWILVMPTWRPWEYNQIRVEPSETPYYRMLVEIYEAVPERVREKVRILPHPLIRDELRETELGDRMWVDDSYDRALKEGALLITDYSSIAYDAFYRGANVVFWWKEKDECMRRYGGHLMLEEETAFGPVCYQTDALNAAVETYYGAEQPEEFVRRYREIVTFHDNRNTERLLGFLERDGLL